MRCVKEKRVSRNSNKMSEIFHNGKFLSTKNHLKSGSLGDKNSNKEDEFFLNKLELDYGNQAAEKKLLRISKGIGWLKGWPKDKEAFWNGEAFMWGNKVSRGKRELIRKELGFLEINNTQNKSQNKRKKGRNLNKNKRKKGRNLDLGCGSYSYIPSVGFDISEKMLSLNDKLSERAIGDLERKLPFRKGDFDSATLVFALNYVKNCHSLLREVSRVLKKNGQLIVVQSSDSVNAWQRKHEQTEFELERWKRLLEFAGFSVKCYQKEGIVFFRCVKS